MGNIFNRDFCDFLEAFNKNNVRYLLVGGFAVILHGYSRTSEKYKNIKLAFSDFGMPVFDMTEGNFLNHPV